MELSQETIRHLRERAQTLGHANALLWGVVRVRVEWKGGHWRLALARADVPVSMAQRRLVAAAFGLAQETHWEGERRHVPALGQWMFVIETEWRDPPSAPALSYMAKLQVVIGEVLDRWRRTGKRPPHPPSHIAAMWVAKGMECDWETGEWKGGV